MRFLWNEHNEFCGIAYNGKTKGTDIPIKPLRQNEKAFWNGKEWEYSFEEIESNFETKFFCDMAHLLSESREKKPKSVYNKDDFIVIGDKEVPESLKNCAFDCAFLGRLTFDTAEDFLREKNMVLRKEIWDEIKNFNELCRMQYLLSNYACFIVGGFFQDGEKMNRGELLNIVAKEGGVSIKDLKISTDGGEPLRILAEVEKRISPGGGNKVIPKEDKITILIPCYKKASYIKETVESAVKQTMLPYKVKVLLMDEESAALKDEIESLASFVECEIHDRLNASAARNYLVKTCETEYFILLDADDTLKENFIEEVYKMEASIVFPRWEGMFGGINQYPRASRELFQQCCPQNLTSLLCKKAWEEVGGLDEDLWQGGEDTDFIIRLFAETKWRIQKTYKTSIYYRTGVAFSSTSNQKEFQSSHYRHLVKNKEILRRELHKFALEKDNFIQFFDDDESFTNEESCSAIFNLVMGMGIRTECKQPLTPPVSFELNRECNRHCSYCNQRREKPFPHFEDDEMFERFDKMLTKLEEKLDKNIMPQILGGEPTIWSDYLVQKILDRLKDYSRIVVLTNFDKRGTLWEKDSRVVMYRHIVDWQGMGRFEIGCNEMAMIVVCHDDVPYLEDFLKANSDTRINIDEYNAEDETKKLTDEDRALIAEIEDKYPICDTKIRDIYRISQKEKKDKEEGRESKINMDEVYKACRLGVNVIRAECLEMIYAPCCGRHQTFYKYEDYEGQLPTLSLCSGCKIANRFTHI